MHQLSKHSIDMAIAHACNGVPSPAQLFGRLIILQIPLWQKNNKMSDPTVLLSLQDICKIYIVAQLDEFPVATLAVLPPKVRQKVLFLFPQADVLHFLEDTPFNDDDIDSVDLSSELKRMLTECRRELIEIVLDDLYRYESHLCQSVTLRLFSRGALDCYDVDNGYLDEGNIVEYVSKWPCLQLRVIRGLQGPIKLALPARFFRYFPKDSSPDDISLVYIGSIPDPPSRARVWLRQTNISPGMQLSATQSLLDYCNLQTAPKQLKNRLQQNQ